ncbi:thiol:disulfide interchange protein [Erythrobacter sp. 3-20A1M]|uniref:protein-disulfide reductase DsbD family protein n=1 Tax=Erythrobacter sp. 3-20A1M TaxID=2653850 RepID=UPI001BFC4C3A|nr:protein-disulfide reductase DsbD domain-containing protein [Erythrobacter sp. 3-20A1M]QWC56095.1 thiol:disulfide interchange protein [Erythrobacter sp. 3-20A1M]
MRASSLPRIAVLFLAVLASLLAQPVQAQRAEPPHLRPQLLLVDSADGGRERTYALVFDPEPGWHGYWRNPGDAGLPMHLEWNWPSDWIGELQYPVPQQLVIGGLMNHVYEHEYAVLVPVEMPRGAQAGGREPLSVKARWLACTDRICVPESATLVARDARGSGARFARWQAAIPPLLDRAARFDAQGDALALAIPVPASFDLADPHVFIGEHGVVDYAAPQTFSRAGDTLVARLPRTEDGQTPEKITGILAYGDGQGFRFEAVPGSVPATGEALGASGTGSSLALLVLGAILGGLILNVMPCVFPILSLKALALAKAGGTESAARRDALAYTAGALVASLALGGLLLGLRGAGVQVGWAFQLQQPVVLIALFLLGCAITANFLGLFEIPGIAIRGGAPSSGTGGSFATGLLAAFVATPCTGPFMAAALGAALVLPPIAALALFAGLGLGLALPFLLLGFVPALRSRLPRPGPWMERFRRWMALPMGLTVCALGWLLWRVGGTGWALSVGAIAIVMVSLLVQLGRSQRRLDGQGLLPAIGACAAVAFALVALPAPPATANAGGDSLLAPQPFSAAALANARASGQPVFVWFTADWCLTCKVNEEVAIERDATADAFERAGVKTLRGDWTRPDPQITQFLAEQGVAGVPLYLWYDPGAGDPEQLPQVLTPDMLVSRAERSTPRGSARSGSDPSTRR